MSPEMPEPWRSFLIDLDAALSERVTIHCLGGFAVSIHYGLARPTADLDVCEVIPRDAIAPLMTLAERGSTLAKKYGVYMEMVTVAQLPHDYDQRLTEVLVGFRRLQLCVLDPYDLALSKLERNSDRDVEDVKHLARTVPLDLEKLRLRYNKELRLYLGRPDREDLTIQMWIEAIEEERQQLTMSGSS